MWRYIAYMVRCRTAFFVLVGEIMSRSQGSADAEDGSQGRFAEQDLRGLRAAVRMAQEMGARLGRGEVLFGAVSGGEGVGVGAGASKKSVQFFYRAFAQTQEAS